MRAPAVSPAKPLGRLALTFVALMLATASMTAPAKADEPSDAPVVEGADDASDGQGDAGLAADAASSESVNVSTLAAYLSDGMLRLSADVALVDGDDEAIEPVVGSFTVDGLTYAIVGEGEVALVAVSPQTLADGLVGGSDAGLDEGSDVGVAEGLAAPGPEASSGADGAIEPATLTLPDAVSYDGSQYFLAAIGPRALAGCDAAMVVLPASVETVDQAAFEGSSVASVEVAEGNPHLSSFDGMLFDADRTRLLLVPEGKQGAARILKEAEVVDPSRFSHSAGVSAIDVEAGSAAFSSRNGCLYSSIDQTLLWMSSDDLGLGVRSLGNAPGYRLYVKTNSSSMYGKEFLNGTITYQGSTKLTPYTWSRRGSDPGEIRTCKYEGGILWVMRGFDDDRRWMYMPNGGLWHYTTAYIGKSETTLNKVEKDFGWRGIDGDLYAFLLITFDPGGGSFPEEAKPGADGSVRAAVDEVGADGKVKMPVAPRPVREGHVFRGYWSEPGGKGEQLYDQQLRWVAEAEGPTEDVTAYAKWDKGGDMYQRFDTKAQYSWSGDAWVEAAFAPFQWVRRGEAHNQFTHIRFRDGVLESRAVWSDGGVAATSAGAEGRPFAAVWAGPSPTQLSRLEPGEEWVALGDGDDFYVFPLYGHEVAFDPGGGSFPEEAKPGADGSVRAAVDEVGADGKVKMPVAPRPVREGHVFRGYWSEPGGKGEQLYDQQLRWVAEAEGPTEDVTAYAKWSLSYDVDVPIAPLALVAFEVDSLTGQVRVAPGTSAEGAILSYMVVPVAFDSLSCEGLGASGSPDPAGGAPELEAIFGAGSASKVRFTATLGEGGSSQTARLTAGGAAGSASLTGLSIPAATSKDASGRIPVSYGLELDSDLAIPPVRDVAPVARLSYAVSLAVAGA